MRYPKGLDALTNVNFEINKGEMVFLTGHSGAGKSTLLRLILALEPCFAGEVIISGANLGRLPRSRVPFHRRQIAQLSQDSQLSSMSIAT